MGRYSNLVLKDHSEDHIKRINQKIIAYHDYPFEEHNGVIYGPFNTRQMRAEDIRFMNEDPEGLLQDPNTKRPIKESYFNSIPWKKIGCFQAKISAQNEQEAALCKPVFQFFHENQDLFDLDQCYNYDIDTLYDYGLIKFLVQKFKYELNHDYGTATLHTTGSSWSKLKESILKAELAPESAISLVEKFTVSINW